MQKPKFLISDVHKAQKTPGITSKLKRECKIEVVLVPPGCTSLVQPLDVSFNGEFKSEIDKLQTEHMQYINNSLSASARRILITKWVGADWEQVSKNEAWLNVPLKSAESLFQLMEVKTQPSRFVAWKAIHCLQ